MNVNVLGLGISGVAAAKLANSVGFNVFVSDYAPRDKVAHYANLLDDAKIAYECGTHSDRVFNCKELILSPGIKKELPIVQKFYDRNIPVISEIEFASRYTKQDLIGITGSNGKTTTTTLLGKMLEAEFGGERMAGNIGIPLSDVVLKNNQNPIALELSSFQLETIEHFKPKTSIWLNVSPNHLDVYDTMQDYIDAKANMFKNVNEDCNVIYNYDDEIVKNYCEKLSAVKYAFSLNSQDTAVYFQDNCIMLNVFYPMVLISTDELKHKGPHHLMNMMAASLAAFLHGVELGKIRDVLRNFNGLEHRMEPFATINDIEFINDSKSTSVDALKMALQSFQKPIILLAGGKHKGASYADLASLVTENVKAIFVFGPAGKIMAKDWSIHPHLTVSDELFSATEKAFNSAKKNDIILLSPACSSFDQFKDYVDRGTQFKKFVNTLK
jgi:UDP-N-acetylmuramoylalanine--D-glutamate ligase